MVLKHEQNMSQNDIEVLVTYPQKTPFVEKLLTVIKSTDIQIPCYWYLDLFSAGL
jgi:hypothetical protein